MKDTALTHIHKKLGARIVPFAGYNMPLEYTGIKNEHLCVRNAVGVFDVSHMGEIWVKGHGATELVQKITTNDINKLYKGRVQYNCFPNGNGGIVDDILVYKYSEDKIIQCALCHKPQGVCFEYVGRQDCGSSGFNAIYKGYLLGSDANNDLINGLHYNSTERLCVNDSFDANVSAGGNLGALWYGVVIEDNFSLNNYTEDAYIMCSVCCN